METIIWGWWDTPRSGPVPEDIAQCFRTWVTAGPDWNIRVLDLAAALHYVSLPRISREKLSSPRISELIRVLLLKEYGGLWVAPRMKCDVDPDKWLIPHMRDSSIVVVRPSNDKSLTHACVAANEGDAVMEQWCAATIRAWTQAGSGAHVPPAESLLPAAREISVAEVALMGDTSTAAGQSDMRDGGRRSPDVGSVDVRSRHGLREGRADPGAGEASVVAVNKGPQNTTDADSDSERLLSGLEGPVAPPERPKVSDFVSLKVSTGNLGDHVQVLAARRLLARVGIEPAAYIDRDHEIAACPYLENTKRPLGIIMNGLFKSNGAQWPPHERLNPVFLGFHMRPHRCPELLSAEALEYYSQHEPIGCRDVYTRTLLNSHSVEAFESNCVTLTLERRFRNPEKQTEVFVVSRDQRLWDEVIQYIPSARYVNQYTASKHFGRNLVRANKLLRLYKQRARLIVTSFLHCALPCIAMGIPVIVVYPETTEEKHQSNRERFSSLERMVPVHNMSQIHEIDLNPEPINTSAYKRFIVDCLRQATHDWGKPNGPVFDPLGKVSSEDYPARIPDGIREALRRWNRV